MTEIKPPATAGGYGQLKPMTPENWRKVKTIYHRAVEIPTGERASFVRTEANDHDLAAEVFALLEAKREAAGVFENLADAARAGLRTWRTLPAGTEFGKYKIVREIGSGGMGTVYLAERADGEFAQAVAVKVIKHLHDSDVLRRRFLNERQILAALRHPHIAQLFDGGTTSDGTPYLVMEYVEGTPVTEYAAEKNLNLRERLVLFRKICAAILYAHRNLVVHRDLKPSNILITEDGTPKLLDFGIAKLLKADSNEGETQTKLLALTPEYASPEQIRGEKLTTATDVYSLGVIFYELLTGTRPFRTAGENFQQIIKLICETEPPRPSSVISHQLSVVSRQSFADDKSTDENEGQPTTSDELIRNPKSKIQNLKSLKGDLDTIALKALRKDAERRYTSVEQFSEDIRRYLNGLPIAARPDKFFYRASKFVRRNRVATVAAVLVFFALTFGIGVALHQARQASIERARAEQRFAETRGIAKALIFNYHDEISKLPGATRVRSLMVADAIKYLDGLGADDSATRDADLRLELIEGYLRLGDVQGQPYGDNLGDTAGALESYRKAENLLQMAENAGEDAALLKMRATVFHRLSQMLIRNNFTNLPAVEYAEKVVALREKILFLEPTAANRIEYARSYLNLGQQSGGADIKNSLSILQKGAEITAELLRGDPDNTELRMLGARFDGRYAFQSAHTGMREMIFWNEPEARRFYEASVPYYRRAIESAQKLVAEEPDNKLYERSIFVNKSNLAESLAELRQIDEALKLFREALHYDSQRLAADAANQEVKFVVAEDYLDLARVYLYLGDRQTATENFERGIKMLDELIEADPKNLEFKAFQISNFTDYHGDAQIKTGDLDGALRNYRRAADKAMIYYKDSPEIYKGHTRFINLRLGDIHRFKAEKETTQARRKNLTAALDFYRRAVESQTPGAPQAAEVSKYLNEKIAECEAGLQ